MSTKLNCNELRFSDYYSHPIWGFTDDDGDEVMPVDYPDHLIWSGGGEALFVLCEYVFNDGTKMDGVVCVRMTDQKFYILTFPYPDGSFFDFPVNSMLEGTVTPEQLASHLEKSISEVFPIKINTPFIFENGEKLVGEYALSHT
jgi:hypothetical protein